MKNKTKKLHGASFYQNIAKFEAFRWNLNLRAIYLFWTSLPHISTEVGAVCTGRYCAYKCEATIKAKVKGS